MSVFDRYHDGALSWKEVQGKIHKLVRIKPRNYSSEKALRHEYWRLVRRRATCVLAVLLIISTTLTTIQKENRAYAYSAGDGITTYGNSSGPSTLMRKYTTSDNAFGAISQVDSSNSNYTKTITSPIKYEAITGLNQAGVLKVKCFNGVTWSTEFTATVAASYNTPRFDLSYTNSSGDAVVLYSKNVGTTNELAYRTKSGSSSCGSGSWSSENLLDPVRTSGTVQWVKIAADRRSGSNLLTAIWADSNSDLSAMQWSGTAWGNEPTTALETSLEVVSSAQDVDDFDVDYESTSGDVLIVWANSAGNNGTNGVRYATCTGGTATCSWTGSTTPPTFADDATNLDLSADPASDKMVFASIGNAGSDLQVGYWSGSAWTDAANQDTSCATPVAGSKMVATGWLTNGGTTRSVIRYDDSGTNGIDWITGNAGTFTNQTDVTPNWTYQDPMLWMNVDVDPLNAGKLFSGVVDTNHSMRGSQLSMNSSGVFTWSEVPNPQALNSENGNNYSFAYWRIVPTPTLDQSNYEWYTSGSVGSMIPGTVASVANTDNDATGGAGGLASTQRKSFYDSVNGKYWDFYYDDNASDIEGSYSSDGSTWTSGTGTGTGTSNDFAVWNTPGTSSVYVGYMGTSGGTPTVGVIKGTLSATSISWGTPTILDTDSHDGGVNVTRSSTGKIFVAYNGYQAGSPDISVIWRHISTTADNISTFGTRDSIDTGSISNIYYSAPALTPLANGDVLQNFQTGPNASYWTRVWRDSSSTQGTFRVIDSYPGTYGEYSVIGNGTNEVYMLAQGSGGITIYKWTDDGTTNGVWTPGYVLAPQSGGGEVSLTYDASSATLYAFYQGDSFSDVFVRVGTGDFGAGDWSPEQDTGSGTAPYMVTPPNLAGASFISGYFTPQSGHTLQLTSFSYAGAQVGKPLAPQNNLAQLPSSGASARLRASVYVAGNDLLTQTFKLQFAGKGTGTCSAPAGSPSTYTDVTTTSAIKYENTANLYANGDNAWPSSNELTHGTNVIRRQNYVNSGTFGIVSGVKAGQDALWDFDITNNTGTAGSVYCFRVVSSSGTALTSYTNYPELRIRPTTDMLLRGGHYFGDQTKQPLNFTKKQ